MGRSIRLLLTRNEEQIATNTAPLGEMRVKIGGKKDGTITALEADVSFTAVVIQAHRWGFRCWSWGVSTILLMWR